MASDNNYRVALNTVRAALASTIEEAQTPLSGAEPPWLTNEVKQARKIVAALDVLAVGLFLEPLKANESWAGEQNPT